MASRSTYASQTSHSSMADPTASRTATGSDSASARQSHTRSRRTRPRTAISTLGGFENQHVVCAVSESRGISPTVGLAFVNLDTSEAILCQVSDSQTYVKTVHKLSVFLPTEVLFMSTMVNPKSKLFSIIEEDLEGLNTAIVPVDRRYFGEDAGMTYIQQLALPEDVDTIKLAVTGNYFAVCSFAAALKFIELQYNKAFAYHSLRIKYEPPEGSMMIDVSTIHALELIQNLQDPKSKHCLFGLLNESQTPMGARHLRSNILQPLTDAETLGHRYDALEELTTREEMFFGVRTALRDFVDVDRLLTTLVVVPAQPSHVTDEQVINNVIMLRHFVVSAQPIYEALKGANSAILSSIRDLCSPRHVNPVRTIIDRVINEDVKYSKSPLDLLNQRTFAVKSGLNGLLDVERQVFKENSDDAIAYVARLAEESGLKLELKYDPQRRFYMRMRAADLPDDGLPTEFTNVVRKKDRVECTTMVLMKRNHKIMDSHGECLAMSDRMVQDLIVAIRANISALFRICESVALLDTVSGFAQVVTVHPYVRPKIDDTTLAAQAARHPIKEKIQRTKFIPNDIYATPQKRFQIITGCNMSGKSTYIRSIALMVVMAQIGCFVPATFATFPIHHRLFARVSVDDSIEGNVSTFAAEMQETAFILRNIDRRSLAIIDELGRGTSTTDGLAIAIAVCEALVASKALVWFATHFTELPRILAERNGVVSLHLAVDMPNAGTMNMLYKVASGAVEEGHYGLALAKVLPLPPQVLDRAAHVAVVLKERMNRKRKTSSAVLLQRRRRLVLGLKELLVQAQGGNMQGDVLREWLKSLQRQFVERMTALDEETAQARDDEDGDEGNEATMAEQSHDGDEEMHEDEGLRDGDMHDAAASFDNASSHVVEIERLPRRALDLETIRRIKMEGPSSSGFGEVERLPRRQGQMEADTEMGVERASSSGSSNVRELVSASDILL